MRATPYSRYPVYRGGDADVLGVLEVKSLLDRLDERAPDLFLSCARRCSCPNPRTLKLLEIFREEQQSLALVVDEYGDVTGMVTVNDLMGAVGRLQSGETPDDEALVVERETVRCWSTAACRWTNCARLIGQRQAAGRGRARPPHRRRAC